MNFEQLIYVETLSHYNSLQEAADVLHISKSGLSLAISQLEDELGVKLFQRTKKGTILTQDGFNLLAPISKILQSKTNLESLAALSSNSTNKSVIRIEYVNTMFKPFIHHYLLDFENSYKNTYFNIVRNDMESIIERVRNHEIDAGFIAMSANEDSLLKGLLFKPVCYSKLVLAVPKDNELLLKDKITLDDLKKQKFCLYDDSYHDYIFSRLQFLCGPLDLILRTDDTWAINEVATKVGAVYFGRTIQGKLSREDRQYDMGIIDIGHLMNDNTTMGWVINPNYELSEEVDIMLEKITEDIKKNA